MAYTGWCRARHSIRGLRWKFHAAPLEAWPLLLWRVPRAVHAHLRHRDAQNAAAARPVAACELADRRLQQGHFAAFRGFLRSEIGWELNRLIMMKRPAHVVIARLDFTAPGLSRRLNRILARMGHGVIAAKLNDLAERYGITWDEVNPASSSQTRSNEPCGYVAKNNRKAKADFLCGCCGHKIHADVKATRNLESGRSAFDRSARLTKQECLQATVRRHLERVSDRRLSPAMEDPGAG